MEKELKHLISLIRLYNDTDYNKRIKLNGYNTLVCKADKLATAIKNN